MIVVRRSSYLCPGRTLRMCPFLGESAGRTRRNLKGRHGFSNRTCSAFLSFCPPFLSEGKVSPGRYEVQVSVVFRSCLGKHPEAFINQDLGCLLVSPVHNRILCTYTPSLPIVHCRSLPVLAAGQRVLRTTPIPTGKAADGPHLFKSNLSTQD